MFHTCETETEEAEGDKAYICDHPGCRAAGQYPAPKSRRDLRDYFFFCLTHVRHYNKNWNYYDGMSTSEIEAERSADVIGHRPLWSVIGEDENLRASLKSELHDFLHYEAGAAGDNMSHESHESHKSYANYDAPIRQALALLQVPPPVNLANIKAVYKNWVKTLHPDSRPDNRNSDKISALHEEQAQDKLKEINQAYAMLKLAFAEKTE